MSKTNRSFALLAGIAAIALTASTATAQAAATHETQAQLRAEAKIPAATARATALAKVPGGRVKKYELERENGHLLYSFDITSKGKTGVDEVQVDAITGAVLSNVHETPKDEKAEAKAEAKEAKAGAKSKKGETKKP
jgi:uncharacterized membrane protein YkoI